VDDEERGERDEAREREDFVVESVIERSATLRRRLRSYMCVGVLIFLFV